MEPTPLNDIMTAIRKEFYALRNGMIADTLRKGGMEQKYIFGLQLPQIKGVADRFRPEAPEHSQYIARQLWSDRECREARLTACHLMPTSRISPAEARLWAEDVRTREEGDILAFRLLRHLPYAPELADELAASNQPLRKYTAEAIRRFI